MIGDWFEIILQNAVYFLWGTLLLVLLIIINHKYKTHQRAKLAERNPEIRLYSYEYPIAKGTVSLFFESDAPIPFVLFIINAKTLEKTTIAEGTSKKGGQKFKLDTTNFQKGAYYYGIETAFQSTEKKLIIDND